MSGPGRSFSMAQLVAERPSKSEVGPEAQSCVVPAPYRFRTQANDQQQQRRQRTARRQALLLMLASSLVTVMALYGAWTLLHRLLGA